MVCVATHMLGFWGLGLSTSGLGLIMSVGDGVGDAVGDGRGTDTVAVACGVAVRWGMAVGSVVAVAVATVNAAGNLLPDTEGAPLPARCSTRRPVKSAATVSATDRTVATSARGCLSLAGRGR